MISGFDVGELSEDSPDDFEGLDASAAHIANLLSGEPADSNFLPCYDINWSLHSCLVFSCSFL